MCYAFLHAFVMLSDHEETFFHHVTNSRNIRRIRKPCQLRPGRSFGEA
jgi:hypothetical protein